MPEKRRSSKIKSFFRKRQYGIPVLLAMAVYNLYFLLLLPDLRTDYLWYLDLLVSVGYLVWLWIDYYRALREDEEERIRLLEEDQKRLKKEMNELYLQNCDLQDYIAKWCHEVKIPLSAALLLAEKMDNPSERVPIREQLERINRLLTNVLLGCRMQSSLLDFQIHPVSLSECVKASIHNHQFFLIRKNFDLDIRVGEETVYSDQQWLVYILDQLISNAIKYTGEKAPYLRIESRAKEDGTSGVMLEIEDGGTGICSEDLRRIFEKGYTGQNTHNGKYKSTGMGLYLAKKIADQLGIRILVESTYGEYTRFRLLFHDNREHYLK